MTTKPSYADVINQLKHDQHSGSSELVIHTLTSLQRYLQAEPVHSLQTLHVIVDELIKLRPSMIVLTTALTRWLDSVTQTEQAEEFKSGYLNAIDDVKQQLLEVTEDVAQHTCELIQPGMTIMVHSRSSQIMAVFHLLHKQQIDVKVITTASAPGNEGYLVAKELNSIQTPTTVITDAEMGLFMPQADINLAGCDSWLLDHHFVNKSGTLLQALAAHHFGKPFWVLADSFKNSQQTSNEIVLESMPETELTAPEGSFIQTANIYFETIPTRLISGRIDEHGLQANL